jgi:hypothetical protein
MDEQSGDDEEEESVSDQGESESEEEDEDAEANVSQILLNPNESEVPRTRMEPNVKPQDVSAILQYANIEVKELEDDMERKKRIYKWLEEVIEKDKQRRGKLTEDQRKLEDEIASECERYGWALRNEEYRWDRKERPTEYYKRIQMGKRSPLADSTSGRSRSAIQRAFVAPPRKTKCSLEETNTAMLEYSPGPQTYEITVSPTGVSEKEREEDSIDISSRKDDEESIAGDDRYENMEWRQQLLYECAKHADHLGLAKLPTTWKMGAVARKPIVTEYDLLNGIPDRYRRIWYNMVNELAHFQNKNLLGNLRRVDNKGIPSSERYQPRPSNQPIQGRRPYTWELEKQTWYQTMPTDYDIIEEYDRWYWSTLLAVVHLANNNTGRKEASTLIREFSCVNHTYDTEDEWRCHHYFMHSAIQRNKSEDSLPAWAWRCLDLC